MYRAFEGPNGWYVALVREDGSHKQPSHEAGVDRLSEREARRLAKRRNDERKTD
jgi:hypothetical protein